MNHVDLMSSITTIRFDCYSIDYGRQCKSILQSKAQVEAIEIVKEKEKKILVYQYPVIHLNILQFIICTIIIPIYVLLSISISVSRFH